MGFARAIWICFFSMQRLDCLLRAERMDHADDGAWKRAGVISAECSVVTIHDYTLLNCAISDGFKACRVHFFPPVRLAQTRDLLNRRICRGTSSSINPSTAPAGYHMPHHTLYYDIYYLWFGLWIRKMSVVLVRAHLVTILKPVLQYLSCVVLFWVE
jgi:hypothetical protein